MYHARRIHDTQIECVDPVRLAQKSHLARASILVGTDAVAPYPPSPDKTDQHVVVTFTLRCTLVTLLGITCHLGVEPIDAAPHITKASVDAPNFPNWAGLCSPLIPSDYRLHRLFD